MRAGVHCRMSRLEQKVAFLVCVFLICLVLAGCFGGGALSQVIRCPAILPIEPQCAWSAECPEPFSKAPHDGVQVEELKAAKLESDADSLACRVVIDGCIRRDRIVDESWGDCPE